ncbi:MAG TPA: hypothetical protein VMF13_17340 [Luteitalea sp.]|nr:hypothetical protein [Luteitalea sp.]
MTTEHFDEAADRSRRLAQLLETMATVLTDFNDHLQAAEADPQRRQKLLEKFGEFIAHAAPTLREAAGLLEGTRIVQAGAAEPSAE